MLIAQQIASRYLDIVDLSSQSSIRQKQAVIERQWRAGVLEAVQVPVGMRAQHDWRLLRGEECGHADVPLKWREAVRNVGNHFTGEAHPEATVWVDKAKGDGVRSVRSDRPVAVVPAIAATVQGVEAVVVVQIGMVSLAVDREGAVLDPAWIRLSSR